MHSIKYQHTRIFISYLLSLDKELPLTTDLLSLKSDSSFTTSKLLGNEIIFFSLNLLVRGKVITLTELLIVPLEADRLLFVKLKSSK